MRIKYFFLLMFGLLLLQCSDQPQHLSGKQETIEVSYVNWACDCANFIETKLWKNDTTYEIKEEDCFFIEPETDDLKIPDEYYNGGYFKKYLRLTGQFYTDKGVPESYERKTPEHPNKARVFRYEKFELVEK